MPLSPGTRLAQYEILGPLGSGGMGDVYRGRDVRLGREVAIKVMADHIAADPDMRQRFETEARAVAGLSHPGILAIHELAVVDGLPFAVMELLEGRTLRERMKAEPIGWRDAVHIAAAVADGLAAAHGKGVIHRDLKPENIFLTSEGTVKILDFGLALQRLDAPTASDGPTRAHTAAGVVFGTFGYMSPEQVTGARVDGRSDIFALGCLLFEMLSGRQLFTGSTPQEVIASVLHDSLPDLSGFDPLAPKELRPIVSRCLERDPARRFETASDLAMALRALLTGSAARATGKRARPRGKSLAVLPFVNASADPQIEYLTDGITESIINSLSQLSGLRVVPRSLVFRYKGLQADPATVGLALNVRTILTGRVVQQGDVLNIQAELVDTTNESQLWGEQFRQKVSDLLTVQEEIAWQISEALRMKLSGEQKKKLRKRPTVNAEAYQEYLRGRYHWHNWSPEGFPRALEHFGRAIAIDPAYAQAYAGLGNTYGAMAYYGFVPPDEGFPLARAAAARALELDPDLPEAHVTLAIALLFHGWDWQGAEREFKRALARDDTLAIAHSMYALLLSTWGRHVEAIASARRARDLDPLSLVINMGAAWACFFGGRHEEALQEGRRTREIAPGFEEAGNVMISAYEELGRYEDAAAILRLQRCYGIQFDADALLAALRSGGERAYWRTRLEQLAQPTSTAPHVVHLASAIAHVHLGEADAALDHLEAMVDNHLAGAVFVAVNPCLVSLRGHPRYEAVVKKLGVPLRRGASAPHTVST